MLRLLDAPLLLQPGEVVLDGFFRYLRRFLKVLDRCALLEARDGLKDPLTCGQSGGACESFVSCADDFHPDDFSARFVLVEVQGEVNWPLLLREVCLFVHEFEHSLFMLHGMKL